MRSIVTAMAAAVFAMAIALPAYAHSGGTNSAGCHTNRKTGDYHCHSPKRSAPSSESYCHLVNGEQRCGYAESTCRGLTSQFGGSCRRQ